MNPDELEVVPAQEHEVLQGRTWTEANGDDLIAGLEKAFDYRGDVTIRLKDGTTLEGYVFDRRRGSAPTASFVRLIPPAGGEKISVRYSDIAELAFTGRDTAAGKSWEAWVKKYTEKKAAGEKKIELTPEALE